MQQRTIDDYDIFIIRRTNQAVLFPVEQWEGTNRMSDAKKTDNRFSEISFKEIGNRRANRINEK